ncbi:MAG TPA: acyloxyacyl hydrolase [Syntrophales bacterium]|nr:acyloxyacyl hydrolase [Syntrophales bacterium]
MRIGAEVALLRCSLLSTVVVIIIVFSGSCACLAEEVERKNRTTDRLFTEMAIITGLGASNIPEGNYQPVLLIGHFGIDLKRYFRKLEDHRGTFSFFLEPQFNTVVNPSTDFEFGIGIGIQYAYPFTEKLSAYIMGSIGPHYISVITTREANGFIWSDTIGGGLYYHLTKNSAINAGYRFRHLSNGDFALPNGGINTNFAIIGYSIFFD